MEGHQMIGVFPAPTFYFYLSAVICTVLAFCFGSKCLLYRRFSRKYFNNLQILKEIYLTKLVVRTDFLLGIACIFGILGNSFSFASLQNILVVDVVDILIAGFSFYKFRLSIIRLRILRTR